VNANSDRFFLFGHCLFLYFTVYFTLGYGLGRVRTSWVWDGPTGTGMELWIRVRAGIPALLATFCYFFCMLSDQHYYKFSTECASEEILRIGDDMDNSLQLTFFGPLSKVCWKCHALLELGFGKKRYRMGDY